MSRMAENVNPNAAPTPKKRLSLSLKKRRTSERRFGETSEEELHSMSSYMMPKNSATSSRWALKNLSEWREEYNRRHSDKSCPEEVLLPTCSKELLNEWLCVYITETRNKNGEPYPPRTVYSLLSGILREMRVQNPEYPNFLKKDDPVFNKFQKTLDNLFKILRTGGVGSDYSPTEGISLEDEEKLWTAGSLNVETPTGLLRAAFFICGKSFCLRGGQEHRNLSLSQLQRKENPDRYVYTENSSKNKRGGLKQMRLHHKVVTVVANSKIGERCPVYILDKYISKLPDKAKEMDLFYCRAYPKLPKNPNDPWYIATPIGKNTLSTMVRDMCQEAGVEGEKSNHSLRVAGTSSLFAAGVPEKLIQSRTGHVSLTALRKYERITDEQELAVSKILTGDEDTYEKALKCSKDISMTGDLSSSNVSSSGTRNADHIKDHTFSAPVNPSVSYNNCTLNMYQTGPLPMMGYPQFPANPMPTWPQVPPYDPNFPPQVPLYEQWKDGEYCDS